MNAITRTILIIVIPIVIGLWAITAIGQVVCVPAGDIMICDGKPIIVFD
jgi:hypothetical protein